MASVTIGGKLSSVLLHGGLSGSSSRNSFRLVTVSAGRPLAFRRRLPARLLLPPPASSVEATTVETVEVEKEVNGGGGEWENILACPICYRPLSLISDGTPTVDSASGASLECGCCKKTYYGKETHLELIAASGAKIYANPMPIATELFRLPLISFLYERGWRQNFVFGGFPGAEKEFELLQNYIKPVLGGRGNIVDASCGSGLFSRLFAKSGLFSLVVALDYSENMLKQCYEFVKQENDFPEEKLVLVRADIARLPFLTGSIDAVHAGAAIHCWSSPSSAVAEISRVLKPGGVFVGTTYILDGPFRVIPFLGAIRQNVSEISGAYSFISEGELEDICQACGLEGFTCVRNRGFVMFSATKPL